MTPSKLMTGDRVTLRNGSQYIVMRGTMMGDMLCSFNNKGCISINSYDEFMRERRDPYNKPWGEPMDIIKVERPCNPREMLYMNGGALLNVWDEESTPLIPKDAIPIEAKKEVFVA